jgi:putative ABC transport system ATP-binding protein
MVDNAKAECEVSKTEECSAEVTAGKADSAEQKAKPPIIVISGLRKVYRIGTEKIIALDSVDLSIAEGEICCFLGTSGSGKSTILNLIAGLEKPSKGSVVIKGKNIEKMSEKHLAQFRQKNLGFIFQSYNLLGNLTAHENVTIPLIFSGVDKKERQKRALEALKIVGLKTHQKHKPSQMSGGQQQRIGIARALITNPKIILADEPTGNLDSKTTAEIMGLIIETVRKNGQTMLLVTHDLDIARYADRIVHIIDGRISEIKDNRG